MSALDMIVNGINSIVVLNCEYLFHNNIVVIHYLHTYIAICGLFYNILFRLLKKKYSVGLVRLSPQATYTLANKNSGDCIEI